MRVELEPAVLLHRRPYRETSLLVETLSRAHGRVGLVARGARRAKGRWRGLLEPMQSLRLSWSGRGELYTLTGAEAAGGHRNLAGDCLYAGFYAIELVLRTLAREDPHPGLFDSLETLLDRLARVTDPALALRLFERDLLAEIGYALPLAAEPATGAPLSPDADYDYYAADSSTGLVRADGPPPPGALRVPGRALLALAAGAPDAADGPILRRLLAAALAPHLGGRPLKSAQTVNALRRFANP